MLGIEDGVIELKVGVILGLVVVASLGCKLVTVEGACVGGLDVFVLGMSLISVTCSIVGLRLEEEFLIVDGVFAGAMVDFKYRCDKILCDALFSVFHLILDSCQLFEVDMEEILLVGSDSASLLTVERYRRFRIYFLLKYRILAFNAITHARPTRSFIFDERGSIDS